jgi:hypothetical protein
MFLLSDISRGSQKTLHSVEESDTEREDGSANVCKVLFLLICWQEATEPIRESPEEVYSYRLQLPRTLNC